MNWFVQLCLSLEYIHGRKMLHRDLKSQNVFLTANNTVKLGDFGISKVLENTNDVAMTVQGTPYYMSPEVCQSKPYDYKSDVWALGCILYELATLKHAFNAENLLGLVFKIVQDKQDPIPNIYSQELKNLVSLLLIKDERQRPNVLDILRMDFVKQHMRLFVETQGQNNVNPKLHQRRDIQPEVVQQMLAKDVKELTAVERQRLKKEQRHIEEFELMKQAAAAAK
jgi:NIMA (never in mitosis gene a)-related kinase